MTNGIGWLDPNSAGSRIALGIFNEPGRIKLVSWQGFSGSVIQRRREMVAVGNLEVVKELDDRYRRLEIPSDMRVSLGESSLVHLGVAGESGARLYVYRVGDVFLVESARFRDQRVAGSIPELADLP
jgi:hypothetical protein